MKMKSCIRTIAFITAALQTAFLLTGCYQTREKEYYSNKENYITEEAVVDNIIFDKKNKSIYFWLSGINESYQDSTFKIEGESVDIIIENDNFNNVIPGSTITYSSAPRYFGDGYCMPIVGICYDDVVLLPFEVGYENLMKMYE